MARLWSIGFFITACTLTAAAQQSATELSQDSLKARLSSPLTESAAPGDESLPPLTLDPLFITHQDSSPEWYLVPYRFNSWLSEPALQAPVPRANDLLLENFPYVGTGPGDLRLRSDSWMLQSRANLLAPWKLQLESQEKYQIWRSILGSVQVGGAAYLLYKHLKKYGLK